MAGWSSSGKTHDGSTTVRSTKSRRCWSGLWTARPNLTFRSGRLRYRSFIGQLAAHVAQPGGRGHLVLIVEPQRLLALHVVDEGVSKIQDGPQQCFGVAAALDHIGQLLEVAQALVIQGALACRAERVEFGRALAAQLADAVLEDAAVE